MQLNFPETRMSSFFLILTSSVSYGFSPVWTRLVFSDLTGVALWEALCAFLTENGNSGTNIFVAGILVRDILSADRAVANLPPGSCDNGIIGFVDDDAVIDKVAWVQLAMPAVTVPVIFDQSTTAEFICGCDPMLDSKTVLDTFDRLALALPSGNGLRNLIINIVAFARSTLGPWMIAEELDYEGEEDDTLNDQGDAEGATMFRPYWTIFCVKVDLPGVALYACDWDPTVDAVDGNKPLKAWGWGSPETCGEECGIFLHSWRSTVLDVYNLYEEAGIPIPTATHVIGPIVPFGKRSDAGVAGRCPLDTCVDASSMLAHGWVMAMGPYMINESSGHCIGVRPKEPVHKFDRHAVVKYCNLATRDVKVVKFLCQPGLVAEVALETSRQRGQGIATFPDGHRVTDWNILSEWQNARIPTVLVSPAAVSTEKAAVTAVTVHREACDGPSVVTFPFTQETAPVLRSVIVANIAKCAEDIHELKSLASALALAVGTGEGEDEVLNPDDNGIVHLKLQNETVGPVFVEGLASNSNSEFDTVNIFTSTVLDFKTAIYKKKGFPVESLRLVGDGRALCNDSLLWTTGVCSGSKLYMLLNLRGGGSCPAPALLPSMQQVPQSIGVTAVTETTLPWHCVKQGLNLDVRCYDATCPASGPHSHAMVQLGLTGDTLLDLVGALGSSRHPASLCPVCHKKLNRLEAVAPGSWVRSLGFFQCLWTVTSKDVTSDVDVVKAGVASDRKYLEFKSFDSKDGSNHGVSEQYTSMVIRTTTLT